MLSKAAKILVVDDMAALCEMEKKMLQELGYENVDIVRSATDAKAMLSAAATGIENYSLVLSDINMPGESGLELLQWARSQSNLTGLKFIIVSSMGDLDNVLKAAEIGADSFLVKPLSLVSLQLKLEKL